MDGYILAPTRKASTVNDDPLPIWAVWPHHGDEPVAYYGVLWCHAFCEIPTELARCTHRHATQEEVLLCAKTLEVPV